MYIILHTTYHSCRLFQVAYFNSLATKSGTQIFCGWKFCLKISTNLLSACLTAPMEDELAIKLCVHGYHIYGDIWEAAVGKSYCVNVSPGTRRTVMPSCGKYFMRLLFVVLVHLLIPQKFPTTKLLTATTVIRTASVLFNKATSLPPLSFHLVQTAPPRSCTAQGPRDC